MNKDQYLIRATKDDLKRMYEERKVLVKMNSPYLLQKVDDKIADMEERLRLLREKENNP